MSRRNGVSLTLAAASLLLVPVSADAADLPKQETPPQPAVKWTTTAGVVSDYRDRGLSYSELKPAANIGLSVEHWSGLYALADAATVRASGGSDVELAVGAGWAASVGSAGDIDLAIAYTGYAGERLADYVEASVGWRLPLGALTPFAGVDYVPAQTPIRGGAERIASNLYVRGGTKWEVRGTPLTLRAELGRERGSFVPARGSKWDWQIGASARLRSFDVGVAYVDTDASRFDPEMRKVSRAGLVATASAAF